MKNEPQKQHAWLQQLVGEWTFQSECSMTSDKPPEKFTGSEIVRPIGSFWVQGESRGEMPDGGIATMIVTLGYDPDKQVYRGTWIGSMMNHLWLYEGSLAADEMALTLNTEGPSYSGNGKLVKYQDIIEIKSVNHRVLTSRILTDDGEWKSFMTMNYQRKR